MVEVKKSDFSQKTILELKPNKSYLVQCDNFKEMESTCNMVCMIARRFPELNRKFRTEKDMELNRILVTRME